VASDSEIIRGAAVAALGQRGVLRRCAPHRATTGLGACGGWWPSTRHAVQVPKRQAWPADLLADRSIEVQCQVYCRSTSGRSLTPGRLYLLALEQGGYPTRKAAAIQFRREWPPAVKFSADARPSAARNNWSRFARPGSRSIRCWTRGADGTAAENQPVVREPSIG